MLPPLRARLRDGSPLTAVFSIIRSVEVIEIIGLAGFDLVILDMEHGPYGIDELGTLILAARARGVHPVVRVARNEAALIGSVLDAGAAGILVPQVAGPAEARAAVAAARFAPEGTRGANPWVRAADFDGSSDWFARANAEAAVLVMIEGREGVENAGAILATPGLDGAFLGPVDLSHALGVPGEIDHPLVHERMRRVLAEARGRSLAAAVFAPTAEGARSWLSRGASVVAVGVETNHLLRALRDLNAAARAAA
ncbi:5-keto-4-deoxy-D-glucarate aldolase [Methylobacterium crusticola]|uniref:5-keto-4-deoxy-D-glucarate aldolase n=1 Tax=Methylobacterium crusticola TaxID=1697972 RepID=A0ABQ4QVI4_9HYPH|nr:aldolase/citrate lyase family protein [Methylobacterium crusticola]GJD48592.1 5-keto-4-deoxy-D-glucarate aldolase [Methylobacterium crusticola]